MKRSNLARDCRVIAMAFALVGAGCGEALVEDDDPFVTINGDTVEYLSQGEFETEPTVTETQSLTANVIEEETEDVEDPTIPGDDELLALDETFDENAVDVTDEEADPSELSSGDELSTSTQEIVTCSRRKVAAYRRGRRYTITVVQADYKPLWVRAANAYSRMEKAAARSGVYINVISGFRTMAQQRYLYNCYRTRRCNGGNLAARPGYSNHQGGIAVDLNTRNARVYRWLRSHARSYGFLRTVPSEVWHWEYRGRNPPTTPCGR